MSFAAGQIWSALRASVKSNASLGTELQRAMYRMLETCSCVIDKPAEALAGDRNSSLSSRASHQSSLCSGYGVDELTIQISAHSMRRELGTRATRLRQTRRPAIRTRHQPTLTHLAARAGHHRHAGV